jgi:DNA mismatch repair protein MutL
MLSSLPKIGLLPEHLIDQIKAGEVIERPGNLIKEIIENSIDAGSKRLELTLKNNGLDLINLKDNGHGICSSDLPLAFSRHATSKINRFEDLYQLHSFGFRGEALASISAISKLQCVTFNDIDPEGAEIRIEGGLTTYVGKRLKNPEQKGTEINIQDLFFNTPARLKFIQSQQSEKNFLKKIILSFILAHPQVEFVIKMDEEEREVYPARDTLKERLLDIIPKSSDQIFYSKKCYEDNELEIYLIPGNIRTPVKFQYSYINQRFVLDKQLLRVMGNALLSSFESDDFYFVIFVNLPTDHIDVNVHPNKTIIKLFETSKVLSLISASVKELSISHQSLRVKIPRPEIDRQESFVNREKSETILGQERHEYNMEGIFSPHQLSIETQSNFIWMGNIFLHSNQQNWEAISSVKLLACYIKEKCKASSEHVIPLLVSQPFKTNPDSSKVKELVQYGLELEKLSADTVVLRGIPSWMNGFPLKEIVGALLRGDSLEKMIIDPREWSQSTWEEMIHFLGISVIRENKISLDLRQCLEDKLK